MTDIAVVIMSFNRPNYLRDCLESLERNTHGEDYDYIILQDGAINKFTGDRVSSDKNINKAIEVAEESDLPNKDIRVNDYNIGIANQRDRMMKVFDEGYDLILQLEDDIVLGKYALRLFEIISYQFKDCVSTLHRNIRYENIENPTDKLDKVIIGNQVHWWSAGIWEETYRKIEERWEDFMYLVRHINYDSRPRDMILEEFPESTGASSDNVCGSIFREKGIGRVLPAVSRATYIGEYGYHFTPDSYDRKPVGEEGPTEFEEDKDIDLFEIYEDRR